MAQELSERNEEMKRLRFVEGLSTAEIAKRYNISRERVGQIVGRNGKDFRRKWTESLKKSGLFKPKTLDEVYCCAPGIKKVWLENWGMERHKVKIDSPIQRSQEYDNYFASLLYDRGISYTLMGVRSPYSILTEMGTRIEVRFGGNDVSQYDSQKTAYPTYRIPNLSAHMDIDFLVAIIPSMEYFVIPNFEISHLSGEKTSIRIPWPPNPKTSKWHQYYQRIDLIF